MDRTLAAHDPGHADGTGVVRDQQHIGCELHDAIVEQLQALAGARQAHLQCAVHALHVVGMHGLAGLEHHVVGDVHDRD